MDLIRLNKTKYFLLLFILGSCAGSSELVNMSSRNIGKDELRITASASLNSNVMPLCHENIDTTAHTSERLFGNYPLPMNPVVSFNTMYGVTNYYETGVGTDLSLIGLTLILNNKIGLTDFKNHEIQKKFGLSFYNKTSYTIGSVGIAGDYDPVKRGHFEAGNYLLMGFFFNNYEFVVTPHIDYNLLMSEKQEYYSISEGEILEYCNSKKGIRSSIINSNLSFINYGINFSLRTKGHFHYEIGLQYADLKSEMYEPILKSKFQFSIGVGYELYSNKEKSRSLRY